MLCLLYITGDRTVRNQALGTQKLRIHFPLCTNENSFGQGLWLSRSFCVLSSNWVIVGRSGKVQAPNWSGEDPGRPVLITAEKLNVSVSCRAMVKPNEAILTLSVHHFRAKWRSWVWLMHLECQPLRNWGRKVVSGRATWATREDRLDY